MAIAFKDCRSARAGWGRDLPSCFWSGSGRGNPSLSGGGLRGALERDCRQVAFRTRAGDLQHGSGYASAFNCLMVRFNSVIRGRLDDVRTYIPYRVYPRFSVNIIIPIGYTLTMMIVLFTMGYGHHRIYTIIGTQKRAGAFTLALFMPLYFGRVSPRYACAAEARAGHDGPPFRLFPDGWEVYLRRAD